MTFLTAAAFCAYFIAQIVGGCELLNFYSSTIRETLHSEIYTFLLISSILQIIFFSILLLFIISLVTYYFFFHGKIAKLKNVCLIAIIFVINLSILREFVSSLSSYILNVSSSNALFFAIISPILILLTDVTFFFFLKHSKSPNSSSIS